MWTVVGEAAGEYGWKIHLSSVQVQAHELMNVCLPILQRYRCPFKVASSSTVLGMLNEGSLGPRQVGKFATIYPQSPAVGAAIAEDLILATKDTGLSGPTIVTDMHLAGPVYARYGTFNPRMIRDRLGMYVGVDGADVGRYTVPFAPPADVANPFAEYLPPNTHSTTRIGRAIGPGYLIIQALQVHAKGSVYLAIDLRARDSVGLVVLKEGRHHCMSDDHGRDMRDRLRNQAEVHGVLADSTPVAVAGDLFEVAGNTYLPLRYIEGRDFGTRANSPYGVLSRDEQTQLLRELLAIVRAVGALHDRGYVHRDISMRNIRVTGDGQAVLLDLEIAHPVGDHSRQPFTQGTPGFVSPQQLKEMPPDFSDDVFSVGAAMLCALTGCDPQRVHYAEQGDRLGQIAALSLAPVDLCRLVSHCIAESPESRPSIATVGDTLTKILETQW